MSANKIPAQTVMPWLKSNLGPRCLAPLTGTDVRALRAAVSIIDLYSQAGGIEEGSCVAFRDVVLAMQPSTRELAYHAIAHVLDWDDRQRIWTFAGLPTIPTRVCAYEPSGSARSAVLDKWTRP